MLPFVDERRLRAALSDVYPDLSPEEGEAPCAAVRFPDQFVLDLEGSYWLKEHISPVKVGDPEQIQPTVA